jgi:hypothetical protein
MRLSRPRPDRLGVSAGLHSVTPNLGPQSRRRAATETVRRVVRQGRVCLLALLHHDALSTAADVGSGGRLHGQSLIASAHRRADAAMIEAIIEKLHDSDMPAHMKAEIPISMASVREAEGRFFDAVTVTRPLFFFPEAVATVPLRRLRSPAPSDRCTPNGASWCLCGRLPEAHGRRRARFMTVASSRSTAPSSSLPPCSVFRRHFPRGAGRGPSRARDVPG